MWSKYAVFGTPAPKWVKPWWQFWALSGKLPQDSSSESLLPTTIQHVRLCTRFFFFFFFFFKYFWRTHTHVLFWGHWYPCFWISGDVSSGFQSQSGFCLIRIAEANVMYIPWDPPLVLHVADLLTDSIAGRRPGSYLAQGYYYVAAVSLEPAINRSWVPRANHSATRPGLQYLT